MKLSTMRTDLAAWLSWMIDSSDPTEPTHLSFPITHLRYLTSLQCVHSLLMLLKSVPVSTDINRSHCGFARRSFSIHARY